MSQPDAAFWDERYAAGCTPWDQPEPPRAFADFLKHRQSGGRAFVPGCGSGYEIRALHEAGWETLGIDYSHAAVARAQKILGPKAGLVR
jgi:SAM-dependent methyltransferase